MNQPIISILRGIEFLENLLLESPASAVIISHDRRFLDKVVTRVWDIRASKVKSFNGNFTSYLEFRQKDDCSRFALIIANANLSPKPRHLSAKISPDKRPIRQNRIKMLSRLERLEKTPAREKKINLSFADGFPVRSHSLLF
jgi:ATP-binding cassette subfamily F protein 3